MHLSERTQTAWILTCTTGRILSLSASPVSSSVPRCSMLFQAHRLTLHILAHPYASYHGLPNKRKGFQRGTWPFSFPQAGYEGRIVGDWPSLASNTFGTFPWYSTQSGHGQEHPRRKKIDQPKIESASKRSVTGCGSNTWAANIISLPRYIEIKWD